MLDNMCLHQLPIIFFIYKSETEDKMNQDLDYNIDNLKSVLPSLGRNWAENSSDDLAKQIRHYEAVIDFSPENCADAKRLLKEALYEAIFFKPWEEYIPPPYVEYEVIKEPPPYVSIQVNSGEKPMEKVNPNGDVELESGDLITLSCFGIVLLINKDIGMCRIIKSELTHGHLDLENDDNYVAAMRAIEMMIVNHAMYGIDVCSEDYTYGIEGAVEECEDLYG
jgi:hypothetical protein